MPEPPLSAPVAASSAPVVASSASRSSLPAPLPGGTSPPPPVPTAALPAPAPLGDLAGPPRPALPAAPGGAEDSSPPASVAGRAVTLADLGAEVLASDPEAALAALERAIERAVVAAEAARERVVPPPGAVSAARDRLVRERLDALRLRFGAAGEEVLRSRYGSTPERLRAECERDARHLVLRDRLVRLSQFREDGVILRVLVVADRAAAEAAAESLRNGADIALLARRLDVAAPASPPPLRAGEIPDPALRAALFASRPGGVLDPVPFESPDPDAETGVRRAWQVFRVVRAWRGTAEPWEAVAARVEESLAAAPPDDAEVRRWRVGAWARAPVSGTSLPRGE